MHSRDFVDVEILANKNQSIKAIVKRNSSIDCLFTAIYASQHPKPLEKENFPSYLMKPYCPLPNLLARLVSLGYWLFFLTQLFN